MNIGLVSACSELYTLNVVKYYYAYLLSARKAGFDPIIIKKPWNGNTTKIRAFKEFLKENSSKYDIIICCDAYDIIFQSNKNEILQKFIDLNVPLISAVEMNCWPFPELANKYPPSPTIYQYLNAGCVIGYSNYLFELYNSFTEEELSESVSEQGVIVRHFLENKSHVITLDYYQTMCQCLFMVTDHIKYEDGVFKNIITNTVPSIFHGNGCKCNLNTIIEKIVPEVL